MVKRIIWSKRAKNDRKSILEYWSIRNKSRQYPRKLFKIFQDSVLEIASNPFTGMYTDYHGVKVKIVRDYKIFYEEIDSSIVILAIWDTRQNPDKLKNIFK